MKGPEILANYGGIFNQNACTLWMAFRDLTHQVYYYRTYDTLNLQKVDLGARSFNGTKVSIQLLDHQEETITDTTAELVEPR